MLLVSRALLEMVQLERWGWTFTLIESSSSWIWSRLRFYFLSQERMLVVVERVRNVVEDIFAKWDLHQSILEK